MLLAAAAIGLALAAFPERAGQILLQTVAVVLLGGLCALFAIVTDQRSPGLPGVERWRRARADALSRDAAEARIAALIEAHKPAPFVPTEQERARVLNSLRPGIVLLSLTAARPAYEKHFKDGRIIDEIHLDRTGGSPSPAEQARLEAHKIARREWFESDAEFRRATERLRRAGVTHEFGGQGDPCGEFAVLRLRGTVQALPRLEALAAEDAGFRSRAERAEAAERFRIYMLRNYDEDWKRNREIYPNVASSPYLEPRSR